MTPLYSRIRNAIKHSIDVNNNVPGFLVFGWYPQTVQFLDLTRELIMTTRDTI